MTQETKPATELAIEALDDFDNSLAQWALAYPLTVFPEPDMRKAHEVLASCGLTLDAISASNMRHVATTLNAEFDKVRAALSALREELAAVPQQPDEWLKEATRLADEAVCLGTPHKTNVAYAALLSHLAARPVGALSDEREAWQIAEVERWAASAPAVPPPITVPRPIDGWCVSFQGKVIAAFIAEEDAREYFANGNGDVMGPTAPAVPQAAVDVLAERERQKSQEGYDSQHDDSHVQEDMAFAASCYATADEGEAPPAVWPWGRTAWKPKDRRRNLVRAGALILAEIERLDRAAAKGQL